MKALVSKMSVVMVAAIALLTCNAHAMAAGQKAAQQGGKGPAVRAIDALDHAASTLTLDEPQTTSIHAILTDATAQATAIAADAKGSTDKADRQAARTKVMELVQQTTEKITALLNEDQKTAFRKALADERAKMREARGAKRGSKGGDQPAK